MEEASRDTGAWYTAEHRRPRAPNGAGLRAWGVGICIDSQCKDPSHFGRHARRQPMTEGEHGFAQGAAVVIAIVARMHDLPTVAADLAAEVGLTIADYERADVDEYDLKVLRKLRREEARFPRGARRKSA